jgi:hypothetical protein
MNDEDKELRRYIIGFSIAFIVLAGVAYVHTTDAHTVIQAILVVG